MASFVSTTELNKSRAFKKRQQDDVLQVERARYEEKEKFKQYKKDTGQDKWILPSLNKRLESESSKRSSKHKNKKSKKQKRKKKEYSSSSSSSSSENSDDECNWVEAKPKSSYVKKDALPDSHGWMQEDFLSGIKTVSATEIKEGRNKQKEKMNSAKRPSTIEQLGQSEKELNPFWKSGGTGLPTESQSPSMPMDASWLRRSLKRMEEQSKETGKNIEVIAAERYGSWQKFEDMLDKAEGKTSKNKSRFPESKCNRNDKTISRRFKKPNEDDEDNVRSRNAYQHKRNKEESGWRKKHAPTNTNDSHKIIKNKEAVKTVELEQSKTTSSNLPTNKVEKELVTDQTTLVQPSKMAVLTEQEKNTISAKIIKAELMGRTELADKLKRKLETSRKMEQEQHKIAEESLANKANSESNSSTSASEDETVVLTRTTNTGQSWPIKKTKNPLDSTKKLKKKLVKVHNADGERERYFADDDRYSLRDLVEREKSGAAEDQSASLSRLSSKMFRGADGENFTLDDMFESQAGRGNSVTQEESRQEKKAISNHQKLQRRLEKCRLCFGNSENPKHLIISIGRVAYLRLPSHRPLQPGHCMIVPMHHCSTGTALDEDIWAEIRKFMQALRNMFIKRGDDCVFLQTCIHLRKSFHFSVECVPLPKELGDMAPIYFKKAIQECESEWSQNKKLVDTRGSSVRSKLPTGLPYFAVDFGLDGGFAHVIEDEDRFPSYFGREILGGMLDAEPGLWRKPHELRFNEQMKLALEFEKGFQSFDWTRTEL